MRASWLIAASCLGGIEAHAQSAPGSAASVHPASAVAAAKLPIDAPPAGTSVGSAKKASAPAPHTRTALPPIPPVPQPLTSSGRGPGRNNQYLLRFDEDYSYLRYPDATAASSPLDPFKFIALDSARDSWLTLIGGERLYFDHNNMNIVPSPEASSNEFEARTTFGADMHLGSHLRFYLEGINAAYLGPTEFPGSTTVDFGVYNAFTEIMDRAGDMQYGIRAGRQELWLGNGLIVCNRDLANMPASWNGARAYADWGSGRIDVFDLVPTAYAQQPLQGQINTGLHLYGVYGSFTLPPMRIADWPLNSSIDPFFLRYTADTNSYQDAAMRVPGRGPLPHFAPGADLRDSIGLRYYGGFGPLDFDYTGVLQTGSTAGSTVLAWMFTTQTDYVWRNLPSKPRLGIRFDGASGGASGMPGDGHVATYQPLYNRAPYYSDGLATSQTNTVDFAPRGSINFDHNTSLDLAWAFYYRQNQGDAIYNGGAAGYNTFNPYFRTAFIRGKYIGSMPDAILHWRQSRYQVLTLTLSYFMPGAALRKIGGNNTYYVQVQSMMFF